MSLSAPSMAPSPLAPLRYLDVLLILLGAPIMLLIGVPASGYLVAAGVWIALRALGAAVERLAPTLPTAGGQIGVRLGYLLGRLFLLAITVILVRKSDGRDPGLTALCVIVFAFTAELILSAATRARKS